MFCCNSFVRMLVTLTDTLKARTFQGMAKEKKQVFHTRVVLIPDGQMNLKF